jgi:hypothetical protein
VLGVTQVQACAWAQSPTIVQPGATANAVQFYRIDNSNWPGTAWIYLNAYFEVSP